MAKQKRSSSAEQSSSAVNEVRNCSSADQVQRTRTVIECEARYKRMIECRSDHNRGTIYLAERPAEGPYGREQIKNQLVNDKPAGQADHELIQEEGTLSSKVMKLARYRNSKL
ncbi:hypothetical protein F511_22475 [Dorcoceras hygrometricum]|uniref:Uncharacterized protein n=1 Tax=Dorcoceras hygrometricum TaxID=472368 RepID=A0A2Z7BFG5_9LAMI|nr:hypothetical protein F511_22475 [Dorcoceras hygrometricum]